MQDVYEKLGVFYLGRSYDLGARRRGDELLLYDARDLTTHAVCVGMTGSGKTGLCISLLEEAALDGVPAIAIDPKGDLGNLLLTFPDLAPGDFRPWISSDEARRRGMEPDAFAAAEAEMWRNGLAEWDQDGDRIRRLREAADLAIYTPGSDAGLPISVLASFAAPPPQVRDDADLLGDRIGTTASSLLALAGIRADPVRSREHILVSTVLGHAWRGGEDLDLGGLIQRIQTPPVTRVGVLEMEAFYPQRDRFELAVALNNLLAAPGFAAWMTGEPLDIGRLLYTPEGRPRVAVVSIAHLSESERMFFVAMLLNEMIGWMRTRPGTGSLRALLYMDEIFGFMPPVAEPPSKKPLLTLLKQARAYGLGLVLATQNPVDLDYKGLSNTGTWFLGRLQTDRDKQRVLDGLEGAAAGQGAFDRREMEEILAGLGKRVFLMRNVHDDGPAIFQTRWAMSYLRGPMTRAQIARLMDPRKEIPAPPAPAAATAPATASTESTPIATAGAGAPPPPVLDPAIPQVHLPPEGRTSSAIFRYRPSLLAVTRVNCVDTRKGLAELHRVALAAEVPEPPAGVEWEAAERLEIEIDDLERSPRPDAIFAALPAAAARKSSYTSWRRSVSDHLYRTERAHRFRSPSLGEISEEGETEGEFRIRLGDRAREERDRLKDELRDKYESRFRTARDKLRRAEQALGREREQVSEQRVQTAVSVGSAILSALFGRRSLGRATTAARGVGRGSKQAGDVRRAEQTVEAARERVADLGSTLEEELRAIDARVDPLHEEFDRVELKPRRADIDVRLVALAWVPTE